MNHDEDKNNSITRRDIDNSVELFHNFLHTFWDVSNFIYSPADVAEMAKKATKHNWTFLKAIVFEINRTVFFVIS
jgi:hypothetical protein